MTTAATQPIMLATTKPESLWSKARKRFFRHKLAMFGLAVLLLLIFISVFAPLLTPYSPIALDLRAIRASRPAPALARHRWHGPRCAVAHSLRGPISLSVGLVSVSISMLIGIIIGSIAGYNGGKIDLMMRLTDMVMTFPVAGRHHHGGRGYRPQRLQRHACHRPAHVAVHRAAGARPVSDVARTTVRPRCTLHRRLRPGYRLQAHLPNTISSITVASRSASPTRSCWRLPYPSWDWACRPPRRSWGNMLRDAQSLNILEGMPWMWLPPGLMIGLAVLSINFIGDGLRDALDPWSVL